MKQTNAELLNKFEVIKRWMTEDIERAMFDARANFLVAQGLLNYTEIVGSFITGESRPSGKNFDTFFQRLGPGYEKLLKRHNKRRSRKGPYVVYDDLRCGLVHEYTIKRKGFVIHNSSKRLTETEMDNLYIPVTNGPGIPVETGVMYLKNIKGKGTWHIIDPKYYIDFKRALDSYWIEVNDIRNKDLRIKFFKRARVVNLKSFNI